MRVTFVLTLATAALSLALGASALAQPTEAVPVTPSRQTTLATPTREATPVTPSRRTERVQPELRPTQPSRSTQVLRQAPVRQVVTIPGVVQANAGWVATGVTVQRGDTLAIVAREGLWSAMSRREAAATNQPWMVGAEGHAGRYVQRNSPVLMPNAPLGALIGRIGDGAPFLIAARYSNNVASDGELFLSINEALTDFRDNVGAVGVAIQLTPSPTPTRQPDRATELLPEPQTPIETVPDPAQESDGGDTQLTPEVALPPSEAEARDQAKRPNSVGGFQLPADWLYIAAAALAGLVMLGVLIWALAGRKPDRAGAGPAQNTVGAGAKVTARIIDDGVAGQSLTLTRRDT